MPLQPTPPSIPPPQTISPNINQMLNNRKTPLSISEMRSLHAQALRQAEAKRTELRLVLSSRYRELVGSSDEVQKMKEISEELYEVVTALPELLSNLEESVTKGHGKGGGEGATMEGEAKEGRREEEEATAVWLLRMRSDLSMLPRVIHRNLDEEDPQMASMALVELFGLIRSQTDAYPLANLLGEERGEEEEKSDDLLLQAQMRMIYLHVETLPSRITSLARRVLVQKAVGRSFEKSRGALCALSLLDVKRENQANLAVRLIDLYYDSKAKLVHSLLTELAKSSNKDEGGSMSDVAATEAESIMIQIVEVLQYDVVLHSHRIFLQDDQPTDNLLPEFDPHAVKMKCSHFLAAHIPLIRNRIRSILVNISVTPSMLADIRQSLYDKTNSVTDATWDSSLSLLVDQRIVTPASPNAIIPPSSLLTTKQEDTQRQPQQFSLWSALFSSTFSSLVHSLLSTSFHSVHRDTMSILRQSLSRAPRGANLRPHEAQRNTTSIALHLDSSLKKLSFDAHKLLVHAEEREESEGRLKQSLYVQTCEIMGRLLSELRRMLLDKEGGQEDGSDATKEFIVGRLAFLFQFKLQSLKILLDPNCAPVSSGGGGMITLQELQSAFDIEDVDDDGLLTFEEAMEAMGGAFSGTQFNGAEMVRSTLLLSSSEERSKDVNSSPQNVTLLELALLSAKGLRHSPKGEHSALGIIQSCLDSIIDCCFTTWARVMLSSQEKDLYEDLEQFWEEGSKTDSKFFEMQHHSTDTDPVQTVSSPTLGYLLSVSTVMNGAVCPADSLPPLPSSARVVSDVSIPDLVSLIRNALLRQALASLSTVFENVITVSSSEEAQSSAVVRQPCLIQFSIDVGFVLRCFFERNQNTFEGGNSAKELLEELSADLSSRIENEDDWKEKLRLIHDVSLSSCDLFLSALFGEDTRTTLAPPKGDLAETTLMPASTPSSSVPILLNPIPSSRRFLLLPVQPDRQLEKLQMQGSGYEKKEDKVESAPDSRGVGGFGFFSSMLKKK